MLKFTKKQSEEKETHCRAMEAARDNLDATIVAYNEALDELAAPVNAALDAFNAALEAAKEWAEGQSADMQMFLDDKSDKWQESEKGQYYSEWINAWEDWASVDEVEIAFPQPLDEPETGMVDEFGELPVEP